MPSLFPASRLVLIVLMPVAIAMAQPSSSLDRDYVKASRDVANLVDGIACCVEPFVDGLGLTFGPFVELHARSSLASVYTAFESLSHEKRNWQRISDLAVRLGSDDLLAKALNRLAYAAIQISNVDEARDAVLKRLEHARKRGDQHDESIAIGQLGVLQRRSGEFEQALGNLRQLEHMSRSTGDDIHLGQALNALGSLHRDRGEFALALEAHLDALDLRLRTRDQLDVSYRNIALLYREVHDWTTTQSYLEKALQAATDRGNAVAFSPVLGSYAALLNDEGQHGLALAAASQAYDIEALIGSRSGLAFSDIEAGRALIGLGRHDEGRQRLQQALAIGEAIPLPELVLRSLLPLTELALLGGDAALAARHLASLDAVVELAPFRPQRAHVYALHQRLAEAQGNLPEALRYARLLVDEREHMLGTRANRQLTMLTVRRDRDDSARKLELLQKDNALSAARLQAQALQQRITQLGAVALAVLALFAWWRNAAIRRLNADLRDKNREIDTQRRALADANERLRERSLDLYESSIRDSLTGTYNRRHLVGFLSNAIVSAIDRNEDLSLLLVDFDHFKTINDKHGHLVGDHVLALGAQVITEALGGTGLLGRYGGEEFVIILDHLGITEATAVAERIRLHAADAIQRLSPVGERVTVSIGVASLSGLADPSTTALLDTADRALYRAKVNGRNRVEIAGPGIAA